MKDKNLLTDVVSRTEDGEWKINARLAEGVEYGQPLPTNQGILEEASKIIHGDRAEDYGDAAESFNRIAGLWSEYMGFGINAHDVAMMMVLLKVSRSKTNVKRDTYVDIAGYAALGADLAGRR